MADLSVTAASVKPGLNAVLSVGTAGTALTAGQVAYVDSSTGTDKLTDDNLAGAEQAAGIVAVGAASGQPAIIQKSGRIAMGATLTPGAAYYASSTAGGICLFADLTTGDSVILLGIAVSASELDLHIVNTGVVL